jgi:hypothetical protein
VRLFVVAWVFSSVAAFALEPIALSEDEFKMVQHYKAALADARVQAMKPDARIPAIAKDAGYKPKELKQAVDKAEAAGDVKARCEANFKEALSKGAVAGRVGRVALDASAAQAVAYVQWFNEEPRALPIEASFVAATAVEACPLVSTITVWAHDQAAQKTRVFQAIISASSARRIKVDKVNDYAETRYLKLFEKLKLAQNGDDLTADPRPTGAP